MPDKNKKKKGRTITTNGGGAAAQIQPTIPFDGGMNTLTSPGAMTPGSRLLPILSLDPRMTSFDNSSPDNALPYAPSSSDDSADNDDTSEPSIPPLANRDDSSLGSSSCNGRSPLAVVSPQMTTNITTTDLRSMVGRSGGTNVPSSVRCDGSSSSSEETSDDEDDDDDDNDDSYDDDKTRSFDEYDDDDDEDNTDDSDEDDMPALVVSSGFDAWSSIFSYFNYTYLLLR